MNFFKNMFSSRRKPQCAKDDDYRRLKVELKNLDLAVKWSVEHKKLSDNLLKHRNTYTDILDGTKKLTKNYQEKIMPLINKFSSSPHGKLLNAPVTKNNQNNPRQSLQEPPKKAQYRVTRAGSWNQSPSKNDPYFKSKEVDKPKTTTTHHQISTESEDVDMEEGRTLDSSHNIQFSTASQTVSFVNESKKYTTENERNIVPDIHASRPGKPSTIVDPSSSRGNSQNEEKRRTIELQNKPQHRETSRTTEVEMGDEKHVYPSRQNAEILPQFLKEQDAEASKQPLQHQELEFRRTSRGQAVQKNQESDHLRYKTNQNREKEVQNEKERESHHFQFIHEDSRNPGYTFEDFQKEFSNAIFETGDASQPYPSCFQQQRKEQQDQQILKEICHKNDTFSHTKHLSTNNRSTLEGTDADIQMRNENQLLYKRLTQQMESVEEGNRRDNSQRTEEFHAGNRNRAEDMAIEYAIEESQNYSEKRRPDYDDQQARKREEHMHEIRMRHEEQLNKDQMESETPYLQERSTGYSTEKDYQRQQANFKSPPTRYQEQNYPQVSKSFPHDSCKRHYVEDRSPTVERGLVSCPQYRKISSEPRHTHYTRQNQHKFQERGPSAAKVNENKGSREHHLKSEHHTKQNQRNVEEREPRRIEKAQEAVEEESLEILDVHQYFVDDHDFSTLNDSVDPLTQIETVEKWAATYEDRVKVVSEENDFMAYFVLDEKLMRLIEHLDKLKCQDNQVATKKKIEVIQYIKKLHATLDAKKN